MPRIWSGNEDESATEIDTANSDGIDPPGVHAAVHDDACPAPFGYNNVDLLVHTGEVDQFTEEIQTSEMPSFDDALSDADKNHSRSSPYLSDVQDYWAQFLPDTNTSAFIAASESAREDITREPLSDSVPTLLAGNRAKCVTDDSMHAHDEVSALNITESDSNNLRFDTTMDENEANGHMKGECLETLEMKDGSYSPESGTSIENMPLGNDRSIVSREDGEGQNLLIETVLGGLHGCRKDSDVSTSSTPTSVTGIECMPLRNDHSVEFRADGEGQDPSCAETLDSSDRAPELDSAGEKMSVDSVLSDMDAQGGSRVGDVTSNSSRSSWNEQVHPPANDVDVDGPEDEPAGDIAPNEVRMPGDGNDIAEAASTAEESTVPADPTPVTDRPGMISDSDITRGKGIALALEALRRNAW